MIIKNLKKNKIAIIGLGYVGLPLLLEFSKKYDVIGFDINEKRVNDLKKGIDTNKDADINSSIIKKQNFLLSHNPDSLKNYNIYIITVPTPLKPNNQPDFNPIKVSTKIVSKYLNKQDLIIYESTVYPGAIEEICVPLIEKISNYRYNKDFFCGYSPERINPGDKKRTLTKIIKITSGSNEITSKFVDRLYKSIITAGTYRVKSIKIAEAAKVIENTQRDLNIALFNELSKIFHNLNLNTKEIIDAAATKWNFIPFKPGLVGGHCIGVDPYYLTYKSKKSGYNPKLILSGRNINNSMGEYICKVLFDKFKEYKMPILKNNILILGYTFKENCSDTRNTKVLDIVKNIIKIKNNSVDIFDPYIDNIDFGTLKNVQIINKIKSNNYDAIILAVAHNKFKSFDIKKLKSFCKKNHVIYDLKQMLDYNKVDLSL